MANRFTDTDKWKKSWFRKLPPNLKCFWIYICDNCNHAGIWDVDFELAGFVIGEEINQEEIMQILKDKIIVLNGNKKWFIPGFIEFQYTGDLNPENKCHASVIRILKKEGAYKGLGRVLQGRKDKVKEKDKDKGKEKETVYTDDFLEFYKEYPKKVGKQEAFKAWKKIKEPGKLIPLMIRGIREQKRSWTDPKFIPHPATWLNGKRWEDETIELTAVDRARQIEENLT